MNYDNIIYPLDKIYSNATGVGYPVCGAGHDTPPTPVVEGYFYIENTYEGENVVTIWSTAHSTQLPQQGTYATEIEYSKDGENWSTFEISSERNTITLETGEILYLRNDSGYFSTIEGEYSQKVWGICITATQTHNVGGPLTSLVDYTSDELPTGRRGLFLDLFIEDNTLVSAENLIIPSDLKNCDQIFQNAFCRCYELVSLPDFSNITSAPKESFNRTFSQCTSLTTGPDFGKITTVDTSAFQRSFSSCSKLSSVIAPSVQSWDTTKFDGWLANAGTNVQGTKTVYAPTGVTIPTDSDSGIPTGWVRVDY